ncbi:MAG: 2Fe-2S iron-sulfur cluster-binding protein, partial [Spirochaetota bacterium]
MVEFTLNGVPVKAPEGATLLGWLRGEARLTGAKNACGEGTCGACSVLVDGAVFSACVVAIERVAGKAVVTVEGIAEAEMQAYTRAFAEAGAVQCGYCTPGMVMSTKALLDRNPSPDEKAIRQAIRRNLCRCTGYARIVEGVKRAADYRAGRTPPAIVPPLGSSAAALPGVPHPASSVGGSLLRVDAGKKARGQAVYVDDLVVPGMLYGAVLRAAHPRARLLALDVTAARALEGVMAVATWEDIPGERFIGHIVDDWPTLIAVGEVTRYVGDAIALVAAASAAIARSALALIRADYEVLEPIRNPEAALAAGAPSIGSKGNILSSLILHRGDADSALSRAAYRIDRSYSTGFTDHAFLEPESALAFPPDGTGLVLVRTGEQNVYDGRRYIASTLGLEE